MRNFVHPGKSLPVIMPRPVSSGSAVQIGALFGVAKSDVGPGASGELATEGVFDLVKAAGAVTQGQKLYWDNANFLITTQAGANSYVGVATQAAAAADATARVKLLGFAI